MCGDYLYYLFQLSVNQQFSEKKTFHLKNERGKMSRDGKVRTSTMQWSSWPFPQATVELPILIGINCLGTLDPAVTLGTARAAFEEGRDCWSFMSERQARTNYHPWFLSCGVAPPILEWRGGGTLSSQNVGGVVRLTWQCPQGPVQVPALVLAPWQVQCPLAAPLVTSEELNHLLIFFPFWDPAF